MHNKLKPFILLSCGLTLAVARLTGQVTNNPPISPYTFSGSYSSGSYEYCAYNANMSDLSVTSGASYVIKAGNSIKFQPGFHLSYNPTWPDYCSTYYGSPPSTTGCAPITSAQIPSLTASVPWFPPPPPNANGCQIGGFSTGSFRAYIDPNFNMSGCSNLSGSVVWDVEYEGDGSIAREIRPQDYQLYPRDGSDNGTVIFSGTTSGCTSLTFKITKTEYNNTVVTTVQNVSVTNNRIYYSVNIHAELSEYSFAYQVNGTGDFYTVAEHVVCGDAYLLSGQSNATAFVGDQSNFDFLNANYGPTCPSDHYAQYSRTYGNDINPRAGFAPSDACNGLDCYGFTGAWGMVLQYQIEKYYGIPVCIINGAWYGTAIDQHIVTDPTHNFFNAGATDAWYNHPEELFNRSNTMVYNAGLENNLKGILWWQGDGNGNGTGDGYGNSDYQTKFSTLYNLWTTYFSGIQKIYVAQIDSWKHLDSPTYLRSCAEKQRELQDIYSNIRVMSTNGILNHAAPGSGGNDIHYDPQGYINYGNRLFGVVKKDLYGETTDINNVTPPNIVAVYKNTNTNMVELVFDQDIYANMTVDTISNEGGDTYANILSVIKFDTEIGTSYSITKSSPSISGAVLSFQVSDINVSTVSYAGYTGPTETTDNSTADFACSIRNVKRIGAYSFHQIPVSDNTNGDGKLAKPLTNNMQGSNTLSQDPISVNVFPNPFKNSVTIQMNGGSTDADVSINDMTGRNVYTGQLHGRQSIIDLSSLKEGVYFVTVKNDVTKTKEFKIIKLNNN